MTGESCRLRTSDRLHSGLSGWGEYMRKSATALDAAKAGYTVAVVAGLSRGVAPETAAKALEEMKANGIAIR